MPRVLGYVFNPIAIYFCFGRDERLRATLYEVRNTFGGAHVYVCPADPNAALQRQTADKRFYVSPFIGMEARYDFALRVPGDTLAFAIEETTPDGRLLSATLTGKRAPLSDRTLLAALASLPHDVESHGRNPLAGAETLVERRTLPPRDSVNAHINRHGPRACPSLTFHMRGSG